ncbi:Spo0B domain-containing protein [Paenibacillus sp. CMAA1364]
MMIWVATVVSIVVTVNQKQNARERRMLIQGVEQTAIKSLNHHRHDWMNDLQIVYGYIQLAKHDKSIECVGRIKERMELEGKIAKLGIPSLVFYLQSFRAIGTNIELELDIADDLHLNERIKEDDTDHWVTAIIECIQRFQYSGRVSWDETRKLTLRLYEDNMEIIASFTSDALSGESQILEQQIHSVVRSNKMRIEKSESNPSSFRLCMPCDT